MERQTQKQARQRRAESLKGCPGPLGCQRPGGAAGPLPSPSTELAEERPQGLREGFSAEPCTPTPSCGASTAPSSRSGLAGKEGTPPHLKEGAELGGHLHQGQSPAPARSAAHPAPF